MKVFMLQTGPIHLPLDFLRVFLKVSCKAARAETNQKLKLSDASAALCDTSENTERVRKETTSHARSFAIHAKRRWIRNPSARWKVIFLRTLTLWRRNHRIKHGRLRSEQLIEGRIGYLIRIPFLVFLIGNNQIYVGY